MVHTTQGGSGEGTGAKLVNSTRAAVLEGIKASLTSGASFIRHRPEFLALATSLGPQHSPSTHLTTQCHWVNLFFSPRPASNATVNLSGYIGLIRFFRTTFFPHTQQPFPRFFVNLSPSGATRNIVKQQAH
jgi:hypothetical protein